MNREALAERIESCQGLVRSVAIAVQKRYGAVHELDDLISYGQIGLAQAARDYDPTRGAQLSTFAYYRIRGAIYEGLSKMGWQRLTAHRDAAWNDILADDADTEATVDADWFTELAERMATSSLLSGMQVQQTDIADEKVSPPDVKICREELISHLHQLVNQLPSESAKLIRETYFQGQTLTKAAELLGINKGSASRMHSQALSLLGDRLRQMGFDE